MPYFRLETNVPQNKIPSDLPQKLCNVIDNILGKPSKYSVATVIGGVNMSWAGSNEPAAQATLMAIGGMDVEDNKKHSKALYDLICKELDISPERMYILYNDVPGSNIGYNGSTLHGMFGK